ncbi:MAG TPA: sulfate adenylyltransferase [Firmicutes bacterium]|jgi:sulfate adenylyltransferase|nr:sulfate adenylyltransferase [Bacillota bacterium]HAW71382.1 sulfate adenylyltransferase [Bacillota bacterium]HBE05507.1 sulfate adenylyltransferase [Bacillota bacterium]HCM19082.1 sulfate adenylyltransferase [Bacillota bacterium]HCT36857.1 sulfate adenylyltransferase [Bacillota bacterium]
MDAIETAVADLPKLKVPLHILPDLELLASGGYAPLTGFLGKKDYESVLTSMRLANGHIWPIPIQLPVSAEDAAILEKKPLASLCGAAAGGDEKTYGTIEVTEIFSYDPEREAEAVYLTKNRTHPGVARLFAMPKLYAAGKISLFRIIDRGVPPECDLTPAEAKSEFRNRGWQRIVGFQTRNPIHRAHEYILKCALEICDGLFLHPLVGETKQDDLPSDLRMSTYQALIGGYFPKERVLLSVFPAAMRYAGPREAVFHALVRRNYGCTHFIVGRDHAGVGSFYGTYDAQRIFANFSPAELGIEPLFFEHTFFCRKCGTVASLKTCPHDRGAHLILSGTNVREMIVRRESLPAEYTRPEVARILTND